MATKCGTDRSPHKEEPVAACGQPPGPSTIGLRAGAVGLEGGEQNWHRAGAVELEGGGAELASCGSCWTGGGVDAELASTESDIKAKRKWGCRLVIFWLQRRNVMDGNSPCGLLSSED